MRNQHVLGLLLLAGCLEGGQRPGPMPEPEPQPDPEPLVFIEPAPGCAATATIVGNIENHTPTQFGPFVSAHLCLRIDATPNIQVAHFASSTKRRTGDISGYKLTLTNPDGTLIRDGWDLQLGDNTFASIETGFDKGTVRDVVLTIRGANANDATMVDVALFEPFE
jgi:hypothetical protein